jgi:enoyl-[acyl-carrier protein] reductase II
VVSSAVIALMTSAEWQATLAEQKVRSAGISCEQFLNGGGSAPLGTEGDIDSMSLWAGQSAGLVSKVQSAADIVREIVDEAKRVLQQLSRPS